MAIHNEIIEEGVREKETFSFLLTKEIRCLPDKSKGKYDLDK